VAGLLVVPCPMEHDGILGERRTVGVCCIRLVCAGCITKGREGFASRTASLCCLAYASG
jgi:hypothetical protein